MHLNYYFLRFLSEELGERLVGFELSECYLQNRFECILAFHNTREEFYIKLNLYREFTCLSFPDQFFKSKKGTYALFRELNGLKVQQVIQHENDRSFHLVFEQSLSLMFKLHGSRSNLILFHHTHCIDLLNKNLLPDREIDLGNVGKKIRQDQEHFIQTQGDLLALYPAFDKDIREELTRQNYAHKSLQEQWPVLSEMMGILNRKEFFIVEQQGIRLTFFNQGKLLAHSDRAIEAANYFEHLAGKEFYFGNEKQEAVHYLHQKIKKTQAYLDMLVQKQMELSAHTRYDEIANIIMANLYQIPPYSEKAELLNFYTGVPVVIKLKKELSPQKNAENYYRKAKNQKLEIAEMERNTGQKREEVNRLRQQLETVERCEELKMLRKYLKEQDILQEKNTREKEQQQLFRRFEIDGFEVLIGKSAKNNDLLTQKYSFKEDLWLHARDVAGSHVLIKYKAGKKFPKQVVEKAAQLAAYYSKRKTDSLCPVIVTPKKYVRKPKGAQDGQVLVDREEVLLVRPAGYDELGG